MLNKKAKGLDKNTAGEEATAKDEEGAKLLPDKAEEEADRKARELEAK